MGWGTNDDPMFDRDYDPNHFYTKVRDDKGHYEQVNIKMPPALFNLLHTIVSDPNLPDLQSPQDLIRDAIVHRLKHLVNEGFIVELAPKIELMRIRAELATADAEYEDNDHLVTKIEANLTQAKVRMDAERVAALLKQGWDVHQLLPERNREDLETVLAEGRKWLNAQKRVSTPVDR